jgi:hypothetical protein
VSEIKLTELRGEGAAAYVEQWACEPPEVGVAYRVLDNEWDETTDPPTRTIHRIELQP